MRLTTILIKFLPFISLWILHNPNSITSAVETDAPTCHSNIAIRENIQDLTKCTYLEAKTFVELVQKSNLFVDTTLFIKETLAIMNQLNIFVIPSHFGRSINLDMYRTFLQLSLDSEGNPTLGANDSIRKLFKFGEIELQNGEKAKLQQPLQISKHTAILEKYQGKFPVIYLDFSNLSATNFTNLQREIWHAIRQSYQSHSYLVKFLEQNPQKADTLTQFRNILEGNETTVSLPDTLLFLSEQLVKKFPNKKVVVLIDNEDMPVNCLRSHYLITKRELGKIYSLMTNLLKKTFMSNPHLHHGLAIASEHSNSGSSNYETLKARNIIAKHDPPSHYFGLTNTTLYLLADQFKVPVPPWTVDELIKSESERPGDWWYQGKSWIDQKQNAVYVEIGSVLSYLMKEYEKMRKSVKS